MELFERILANIDKVDGHWLWRGCKTWNGYGAISVGGRYKRAHIIAYEEFIGPIPKGLCVLHTSECVKMRHCVNPEHLYLGNRGDNSKDCFTTGGRGRSHLTDDDVIAIRLSRDEYAAIASKYNISAQAVSQIKHKHTWKDLSTNTASAISPMARTIRSFPGSKGNPKVSNQDVQDIRSSALSRSELALKYGLTKESITHILKRHTFRNL